MGKLIETYGQEIIIKVKEITQQSLKECLILR